MASSLETRLMKDKSGHVYLLVALSSTGINVKDLSVRLGLGKKALLDVADELHCLFLCRPAQNSIFQHLLPASKEVVVLVDSAVQKEESVNVPSPDQSGTDRICTVSGVEVYTYLQANFSSTTEVDFQDKPKIGKSNPPDLAEVVSSAPVVEAVKQAADDAKSAATQSAASTAPVKKAESAGPDRSATKPGSSLAALQDVNRLTSTLMQKILTLKDPAADEHQSAARCAVEADIRLELTAFKNAAYASGHSAARGAMRALFD